MVCCRCGVLIRRQGRLLAQRGGGVGAPLPLPAGEREQKQTVGIRVQRAFVGLMERHKVTRSKCTWRGCCLSLLVSAPRPSLRPTRASSPTPSSCSARATEVRGHAHQDLWSTDMNNRHNTDIQQEVEAATHSLSRGRYTSFCSIVFLIRLGQATLPPPLPRVSSRATRPRRAASSTSRYIPFQTLPRNRAYMVGPNLQRPKIDILGHVHLGLPHLSPDLLPLLSCIRPPPPPQGVGMGNPLVDPETQYGYYATMAVNNTYGVQVVDQAAYRQMTQATAQCQDLIRECQKNDNVSTMSLSTRSIRGTLPVLPPQGCKLISPLPLSKTGVPRGALLLHAVAADALPGPRAEPLRHPRALRHPAPVLRLLPHRELPRHARRPTGVCRHSFYASGGCREGIQCSGRRSGRAIV